MTSIFGRTVKPLQNETEQGETPMSRTAEQYAIETIGPREAVKYLATMNGHNRTERPLTTRKYAVDMKDDKWKFNPSDAITFDRDGQLRNGHHRLRAVALSGTKHRFLVCRNADPETYLVMDNGAVRQVMDTTAYSKNEVSVGRAMMKGARTSFLSPSNTRLKDFLDEHAQAIAWANTGTHHGALTPTAAVRGAMARAYGHVDQKMLDRFRYIVINGRDQEGWLTSDDSAAAVLRDLLLSIKARQNKVGYVPRTQYLAPRYVYLLTELAIIRFVERKELKQLRLPKDFGEQFPLPEDRDRSLNAS